MTMTHEEARAHRNRVTAVVKIINYFACLARSEYLGDDEPKTEEVDELLKQAGIPDQIVNAAWDRRYADNSTGREPLGDSYT